MGPHEPYWRTNTSFSPPPQRWDFRFQSDLHSFGSQEGNQMYGSSTSSTSRESRSWIKGGHLPNHQHSASDGVAPLFSSPSDLSPAQQWTPPMIQEISVDDYGTSSRRGLGPLSYSPTMEGNSSAQESRGSTSSCSDASDFEAIAKLQSCHRNFSGRRCFMSKPIHPLTLPAHRDVSELSELERERHDFIGGRDAEFAEVAEDSGALNRHFNMPETFKCGLCERFLSQRSPWSSRRIVKSSDMPVTGVLSCRHVYHAECLDQTTPKARKNDPPCPICAKLEEESLNSPDQQRVFSKLRTSRAWGCAQAGDCVEGALNVPSRNALLLLNRNRIRKNLSLNINASNNPVKEFPGKLRVIGSVEHGAVGSSKTTGGGSSMK